MPKNNKAVHFIRNGEYLCRPGVQVVKEKSTRIKAKVTCKNCLASLNKK